MPRLSRSFQTQTGSCAKALLVHKLTGELLEVNQAACHAFGYTRAELLDRAMSDLEPDFRSIELATFLKQDQEHDALVHQTVFRRKDGSNVWVEVCHLRVELDRNVLCVSVLGTTLELSESETSFSEAATPGLKIVTPAVLVSRGRQLRFVNRTCLDLFGHDDLLENRESSRLTQITPHWRQILAQRGADKPGEFRGIALRKDGSAFPFAVQTINVRLREGQFAVTCITDMSKSKEADMEAKHFTTLAETNPNATLVLTAEGNLLYINPAARRMTEAAGQINPLAILPLDWKTITEDCLAMSRSGHRYETTVEGRTIAWSFIPTPDRNAVRCFARIVTEQKFLCEPSVNGPDRRSMALWAEGIAHELNNILTLIQSHASFLLTEKKMDDESVDSTRQIYSAVDRAAGLTEKLLMMGRPD
jgi:PAS domain S-box-containing protein